MCPLTARDNDSVCEVREQFVELICTDIDLMRAEFDAIIEASWGGGVSPPQPGHAQLTPGPAFNSGGGPGQLDSSRDLISGTHSPRTIASRWPRSPPHRRMCGTHRALASGAPVNRKRPGPRL